MACGDASKGLKIAALMLYKTLLNIGAKTIRTSRTKLELSALLSRCFNGVASKMLQNMAKISVAQSLVKPVKSHIHEPGYSEHLQRHRDPVTEITKVYKSNLQATWRPLLYTSIYIVSKYDVYR